MTKGTESGSSHIEYKVPARIMEPPPSTYQELQERKQQVQKRWNMLRDNNMLKFQATEKMDQDILIPKLCSVLNLQEQESLLSLLMEDPIHEQTQRMIELERELRKKGRLEYTEAQKKYEENRWNTAFEKINKHVIQQSLTEEAPTPQTTNVQPKKI